MVKHHPNLGWLKEKLSIAMQEGRQKMDWSQAELAKFVGVSRQTISMYESGEFLPRTLILLRLADALSIDLNELSGGPDA